MKKMIFTLMALMLLVGGMAMAQHPSTPGLMNRDSAGTETPDPHYNHAYSWVAINADMPGQVAFDLPAAAINIDLGSIVPNNTFTLRMEVRNESDREISVVDEGFTPDPDVQQCGFTVTANEPLSIPVNATRFFTYTVNVPGAAQLATCIEALENGAHDFDGWTGYKDDTNELVVQTRLEATGVVPTPDTDSALGF